MPSTERGPGGWPVDPKLAFFEAQSKFHEARKEADHWRANHADLLRRFKVAQGYRDHLVDATALLKRVLDESQNLSAPRRAITELLERADSTLEGDSDRG